MSGKAGVIRIIEQRAQISFLLKKVPSLKSKLEAAIGEAYPEGSELAGKETGLPKATFPVVCPYSVEQLLDDEFYPESH